jgi:hypothetical protein
MPRKKGWKKEPDPFLQWTKIETGESIWTYPILKEKRVFPSFYREGRLEFDIIGWTVFHAEPRAKGKVLKKFKTQKEAKGFIMKYIEKL